MLANTYIDSILNAETIGVVLETLGAKRITKGTREVRCCCPLHSSNNPNSFKFNLENKLWICYVEKIGGNIFTLIRYYYKLETNEEALKKLGEILCIDIEGLEINEDKFKEQLEVKAWLNRILNNNECNKEFNINTLGLKKSIKRYRQFNKEILDIFEVYYLKDMNRICFPIRDENSMLIGASLRKVNENDKIKWLHEPSGIKTKEVLYNINNCIKKYSGVFLVEGIIDVISLYNIGIPNAVASFGCSLSKEQLLMLMKHFDDVIIAYDNDIAGEKGRKKAISTLKNVMNVRWLEVKNVKDVGEIKNIEEFNKLKIKDWWEK